MRPLYVGFALAGFGWMVLRNNRLMLEAPLIFLIFLIPPAIVLYYGLTAEEPKPKPEPPRQPPANCTPPDSVLAMLEPTAPHPAQKPVAPDSFYLPPVIRTPPASLPDVHKTAAPSPAGKPVAPDSFYLPPVTRTPPSFDEREPVAPLRSVIPDSPRLITVQPATTTPPAPPSAVQAPAEPLISGIPASTLRYTVQPSRTIALTPPDGVGEPDAVLLPGEPAGTRMTGALRYAAAAVSGSGKRFVLLVLATLFFAVPLSGYLVRVMKGADPAPEVQGWTGLVIDGIKADLIVVLYLIAGFFFATLLYRTYNDTLALVVLLACMYFLPASILSFARTGSFTAAFRPGSVIGAIGKIGWLSYTGFCILCFVLNIGISFVYLIPYAGLVLMVLLIAPLTIFEARYLALLAERGGA